MSFNISPQKVDSRRWIWHSRQLGISCKSCSCILSKKVWILPQGSSHLIHCNVSIHCILVEVQSNGVISQITIIVSYFLLKIEILLINVPTEPKMSFVAEQKFYLNFLTERCAFVKRFIGQLLTKLKVFDSKIKPET